MYLTSSGAGVLGTFLPNLSAALSWGIVAGSVSEPGRNQEESGEKLLRKLMRSQVFSEVFRASSGFSPENRAFNRAFSGVSPGFCPGNPAFRGAFLTPRGGFPRAFKTAVHESVLQSS